MTTLQSLNEILERLTDEQVRELLDFARFLELRRESTDWREFALSQLATGYSDNEPEYTEADIKPELNH